MAQVKSKISIYSCQKVLVTFIAAVIILLPMASCDGNAKDNDSSFMEKYEEPEMLEYASVKFLFPGTEPRNWKNVKAEIEKRCADTLNVSLDFKWAEFGKYMDTVTTLDASGDVYDAFVLAKPDVNCPDFTVLAREGKLKDITKAFLENASSLFSKYTSEEFKFATLDGKLYAVPSLYPKAFCSQVIADDALLKKYNISDINNYDEYEAFLKTIKDNEPDLTPGTISNNVADTLKLFSRGSGYIVADASERLVYKWDDSEMKLIPWEKTPEFYNIVTYITEWFKKGYLKFNPKQIKTASFIYEEVLTPPSEKTTTVLLSAGSGKIKESNPMRTFQLYPEKPAQRDNSLGTFNINGSFVFPAASANTERALRFLEWVQQSRDNYFLMIYGIEGKDYVLDNGRPTMPDGMNNASRSYMDWDGSWAFRNIEYECSEAMVADSEESDTLTEYLDKNSKYPPHGAFYPDYGVMQQTALDRQNAFNEFEKRLMQGKIADMVEVDAFIKGLEEIGSTELVEEAQKQLQVN